MRSSTKKGRQQRIVTGMAALALLVLGACATPSATLSPPVAKGLATPVLPRAGLPLAPRPETTPAANAGPEVPAPPLSPARPAETLLPVAAIPETTTIATTVPPDYHESSASYYAKRFNGRRTFTGERYDPAGMTAATRDYPLQRWLKVINPANGREVTVRINDRTGPRKTPLIDLSAGAAKELGFFGKGRIHVHVVPLLAAPIAP